MGFFFAVVVQEFVDVILPFIDSLQIIFVKRLRINSCVTRYTLNFQYRFAMLIDDCIRVIKRLRFAKKRDGTPSWKT